MTGLAGAASVSPSAFWYLTRGSGIVTLVLLTACVLPRCPHDRPLA